jgi:ABC-type phosphate transport system substrate-binding protein
MLRTLVFAVVACGAVQGLGAQEFQVVANPSVSVAAVSASELSDVFLKKAQKVGGAAVSPVDQGKTSALRAAFAKRVHGRATTAIDAFWQQQIFSGGESPPPSKASDDEVVAWVKATPGGIGYISAGAAPAGVKVVAVK